jgi:Mg2+/Co2+ transporter CorC
MKNNHIHRVVVEDTKTFTFTGFITYETIFEYFVGNYYSDMSAFQTEINKLGLTTKNVVTVDKDEPIINCLEKFWFNQISILPINEQDSKEIFGFFYLKDIVYFFANGEKFSVNNY